MRRQVELVLAHAPPDSPMRPYWTAAKLDDVFDP
jgi:hypothetical protein